MSKACRSLLTPRACIGAVHGVNQRFLCPYLTVDGVDMNLVSQIRTEKEKIFRTHDGVDLFYRYWPALSEKPRGAIVLFHRGHEHSGRMAHIVDELQMTEYAFFAWDARGHGRSPGKRGYSPSFATSVLDIHSFMQHISTTYGIHEQDTAVIAQSVGAVMVSTWVHDYAPNIRCMVLASPAFKVKLYIPFARLGIKVMQAFRGVFFVNSYVKPQFLSHDSERIESYKSDSLITRPIASNILLSLYETAERVIEDAAAITVPTQLLISGADWVVHHWPQHRFYARLGSIHKERHILDGFYHDTLGEKDRKLALDKARQYVERCFEQVNTRVSLTDADKSGFTRYEADVLSSPLPLFSVRGLYWLMVRLGLRFGGLLSEGIKLGYKTGFDSGSTLDYVYENRARGAGKLGQFIDRVYLDSIGWRGIRQRKLNLEELVRQASDLLRRDGKPVHIMDVAAGHGRYILEALETVKQKPESVLLRDYSDLNVKKGHQLIREKGMGGIATFVNANAFEPNSYPKADPRPTLGVVSGLYELFPDNAMIRASLKGFAESIQSGGYLIYTGQPWHPQLEMIARALTSHRQGQAWVMRRRTQGEMDQLVAEAGFEKMDQRIDEFGIFTVSLAKKR